MFLNHRWCWSRLADPGVGLLAKRKRLVKATREQETEAIERPDASAAALEDL